MGRDGSLEFSSGMTGMRSAGISGSKAPGMSNAVGFSLPQTVS
jgi:hypothetical protein